MTVPLIAPLIPPRARPGAREQGRTAPARRLPVAAAPEVPPVPEDVVDGAPAPSGIGRRLFHDVVGVRRRHPLLQRGPTRHLPLDL
jgi:hypothetical protein